MFGLFKLLRAVGLAQKEYHHIVSSLQTMKDELIALKQRKAAVAMSANEDISAAKAKHAEAVASITAKHIDAVSALSSTRNDAEAAISDANSTLTGLAKIFG